MPGGTGSVFSPRLFHLSEIFGMLQMLWWPRSNGEPGEMAARRQGIGQCQPGCRGPAGSRLCLSPVVSLMSICDGVAGCLLKFPAGARAWFGRWW